jgi:hypothetical protein
MMILEPKLKAFAKMVFMMRVIKHILNAACVKIILELEKKSLFYLVDMYTIKIVYIIGSSVIKLALKMELLYLINKKILNLIIAKFLVLIIKDLNIHG